MHPELFELKALVAGRLDPYRRREIDDHLGSCADCSRHYVALMLGSASPKTAEAEARAALVHAHAGALLSPINGASESVSFGIDAPIAPSAPRPAAPPTRLPHNNLAALETVFTSPPREPASPSLVDAITRLRSESEAASKTRGSDTASAAPEAAAAAAPTAPVPVTPPVPNRVRFVPTPRAGIAHVRPNLDAAAALPGAAREPLVVDLTTPRAAEPVVSQAATPTELVVTFSSEPKPRRGAHRSPATSTVVALEPTETLATTPEYVSQAIPNFSSVPVSDFELAQSVSPRRAMPPKGMLIGGGALAAATLAFVAYSSFQSSVSSAAAAAAAAAAKQVQAAAARTSVATAAIAPSAQPQVQTRIVYVREPAKPAPESSTPEQTAAPAIPITVALPDVNLQTGSSDAVMQANASGNATADLARSARATASRTATARP